MVKYVEQLADGLLPLVPRRFYGLVGSDTAIMLPLQPGGSGPANGKEYKFLDDQGLGNTVAFTGVFAPNASASTVNMGGSVGWSWTVIWTGVFYAAS